MSLFTDPDDTNRLVRASLADLRLYHGEALDRGDDISSEIEERRRLFRSRVSAELHGLFEQGLLDFHILPSEQTAAPGGMESPVAEADGGRDERFDRRNEWVELPLLLVFFGMPIIATAGSIWMLGAWGLCMFVVVLGSFIAIRGGRSGYLVEVAERRLLQGTWICGRAWKVSSHELGQASGVRMVVADSEAAGVRELGTKQRWLEFVGAPHLPQFPDQDAARSVTRLSELLGIEKLAQVLSEREEWRRPLAVRSSGRRMFLRRYARDTEPIVRVVGGVFLLLGIGGAVEMAFSGALFQPGGLLVLPVIAFSMLMRVWGRGEVCLDLDRSEIRYWRLLPALRWRRALQGSAQKVLLVEHLHEGGANYALQKLAAIHLVTSKGVHRLWPAVGDRTVPKMQAEELARWLDVPLERIWKEQCKPQYGFRP